MKNSVKENKNKKLLKFGIIAIVSAIFLLSTGVYFVFGSSSKGDFDDGNKKDDESVQIAVTKIDLRKEVGLSIMSSDEYVSLKKSLKINDTNIDIEINKLEINPDFGFRELKLNSEVIHNLEGKLQLEGIEALVQFEGIEVLQDLIVIYWSHVGGGVPYIPAFVINQQGEVILDISKINFGENFLIQDYSYSHTNIARVKDNKIIVTIDKEAYSSTCPSEYNCLSGAFDGNTVTKDNYNEYVDRIYSTTFEIGYLGNQMFSEPKIIEEIKLKDKYSLEHFNTKRGA